MRDTSITTSNHEASGEKVTLNYNMLEAVTKTTLPDKPFREMTFELTGNIEPLRLDRWTTKRFPKPIKS